MIPSEMYHAAIKILENRSEQLGDDELMHYGRKGMKWGEDIYAEDETAKRQFTDEDRKRGQDVRLKQKGQAVREAQRQERTQKAMLDMKAKVLAEKARREGRGPDQPASRPNYVTTADMEARAAEQYRLNDKKNELLGKAYAEKDARNNAINSNNKSKADNYFQNLDTNIATRTSDYLNNNDNAKLYSSLMKDAAMDRYSHEPGLAIDVAKKQFEGKFDESSKREKSGEALEKAMRNQLYKQIDDEIDENLKGVYSDTAIANVKLAAHNKIDDNVDKWKKDKQIYYTPLIDPHGDTSKHDQDVVRVNNESAQKFAEGVALSTGGLKTVDTGGMSINRYNNEVLNKNPDFTEKGFKQRLTNEIEDKIKSGQYNDPNWQQNARQNCKNWMQEQLQNEFNVQNTHYYENQGLAEALMGDETASDIMVEASNQRLQELYKVIDDVCNKYKLP